MSKTAATVGSTVPSGRKTPSDELVGLNFKVRRVVRRRFRHLAAEEDLKNIELLERLIDSYERGRAAAAASLTS